MKILFLFTQNQGVISDFFMEMASRLVKDGHEVFVFSLKKISERKSIEGVQVIVKKKGRFLHDYKNIFGIYKLIKPDVAVSSFSYVSPSLLSGKFFGTKKNIIWSHTLKDQIDQRFPKNLIKKTIYQKADVIVVNSKRLGEERSGLDGVKKSRIVEIPYWSNLNKLIPTSVSLPGSDENFLIGCPGRITIDKNQIVLINAVAKFKNEFSKKIKVLIAGEGPNEKRIKRNVVDLKVEQEVQFIGLLNSREMVDFYMKMDVIVLPSLHESFGLVLIETLSLGAPVLVSSKFGALDFIKIGREKLDQITFDPGNPEELGKKLLKIAEEEKLDKSFYKDLYTQNFDKELIYFKFSQILEG